MAEADFEPRPRLNITHRQQNERVDFAIKALEARPRVGSRELFLLDGDFGLIDHAHHAASKLEDVEVPNAFADRLELVSGTSEVAQLAKPDLFHAVRAELVRRSTTKLKSASRVIPHPVVDNAGNVVSGIALLGQALVACKPMKLNTKSVTERAARAAAEWLKELFCDYPVRLDDLVALFAFMVGLRILDLPRPALLLLGPPGTGKTQLAQALAPGPDPFGLASVEGSGDATGRQVQGLELRSIVEDSPHGVVLDESRTLSGGFIGSLVSLRVGQTLRTRLVGRGRASRIHGGLPLVLTSNRITIDEQYVRRLVLVQFHARDTEPVFTREMPDALRDEKAQRNLLLLASWAVREAHRFAGAPRLPGFERFSAVGHAVAEACRGRFLSDRERLAALVKSEEGKAGPSGADDDDALVGAVEGGARTAKEAALRVGRPADERSIGMALTRLAKAGRLRRERDPSANSNRYFPLAGNTPSGARP